MPTYKTPGVYVEEISIFPPSVAEVETAIPAFIGYTQIAKKNADNDLKLKPTKIYSLKDYEQYYGYPKEDTIDLTVINASTGGFAVSLFTEPTVNYLLYYSIKMFFDNGGGQCYIISVGGYPSNNTTKPLGSDLTKGLSAVELEDEPTLIVIPEAVQMTSTEYGNLVKAVLNQCNKLGDRFAIFDLYDGKGDTSSTEPIHLNDTQLSTNRDYFGNNYLKYGSVYYPFLKTTLNFHVNDGETNVNVTPPAGSGAIATATVSGAGVITSIAVDSGGTGYTAAPNISFSGGGGTGAVATATVSGAGVITSIAVTPGGTGYTAATKVVITPAAAVAGNLASFKTPNTALYNFVKSVLKEHFVILPPSGAIAGIYAAIDSNRGVWKAPANVSLANVIEPVVKLDDTRQENLNVDATTGKSINAIRAFMGKGTLVWGARTLAGNDNEWRYISVRRFYNTVEESIKKSTFWAVFEPNDANTWVKVRGMIENYLTQKWREGALAGATPKDAFFVKCGLGITMTSQDILEGRMNVEIGLAVVRPAEFIIMKFSHKLQTS
ncbi:phage tail sheath C-terminal domain-containing protein [Chamaesiphon sp. VAR_48_metabat_135_sub]|uniref:phage tail sheath family protein n=1 Tax=Chamaesiphon sp. VAR_48_metabat_135_sub TaxID=2964699 RepID=UPI00286BCFCB|nr:phage tail sheath C-terminal domain-containing protein [Chamaesiphon sp. VAR_48_metabat_135_sub]